MKISFNYSHQYNCKNFKNNDYTSFDFLNNKSQPRDIDIIAPIIKTEQQNSKNVNINNILYSIGKIFEKAELFDSALSFFEKIKHNALEQKDKLLSSDIDFDIQRIYEKENEIIRGGYDN